LLRLSKFKNKRIWCEKPLVESLESANEIYLLMENNNNMLLKIDIEGDEYESLSSVAESSLNKFMSIVVEYHWLSSDDNIQNKIECIEKINKLFYPVHIHGNNHAQVIIKDEIYHVPDVIEVSYIRKDLYDGHPSFTKDKFPTSLDYPNHGFYKDIKFNFYPFRPYYFSLSVIPSRIPNLNSVIEKLQNQHIKPEKIFVNIPKYYERFNCEGFIPTNIKDMSNVVINICEKDYGPATKFLPIMNIDEIDDIEILDRIIMKYEKKMKENGIMVPCDTVNC
jgi:hypothetical protein